MKRIQLLGLVLVLLTPLSAAAEIEWDRLTDDPADVQVRGQFDASVSNRYVTANVTQADIVDSSLLEDVLTTLDADSNELNISQTAAQRSIQINVSAKYNDSLLAVDREWRYEVLTHYDRLLVTYREMNATGATVRDGYRVLQDAGEQKVAFTAEAEQVNRTTTRQSITLDNAYGGQDSKVVGLVYDTDADIQTINWSGLDYTPVPVTYDGFVKPAVTDAGLSEDVILDSTAGFATAYYNVTVPADATPTVTTTFQHPPTTRDAGNRLQLNQAGPFYTYIVGSGGALKITFSQELCGDVTNSNGEPYNTITIDATATVCQKNSSSWTGQVNLTAAEWVNVTSNGKIDGAAAGYAGGSGGNPGPNQAKPGNSGSGSGGGGGGDATDGSGIHEAAGGGGAGFGDTGGGGGDAGGSSGGGSGSKYSNESERKCFLGSGGGGGGAVDDSGSDGGNGGRGGGCVHISAYTTMVQGEVTVNGANGGSDSCGDCDDEDAAGGGGGGAGGTIWIEAYTLNVSSATLTATGGSGGNGATFNEDAGGGGGGAGGRIKLFYEDTLDNSSNSYDRSAGGSGSGDGGSNGAGGNDGTQYWELLDMGFNFIPDLFDTLVQLFSGGSTDTVKANISINDDGEQDIRSYTPTPPQGREQTFTNGTLVIANTSTSFNWTVSVTDFDTAVSDGRDINFTVTVPHVYGENSTGPVNATHQTVNTTARIVNHGANGFDFKAGFTPPSGLITTATPNNRTVQNIGTGATVRTDWTVDHLTHQATYSEENTSIVSNVTHQYIDRPKQYNNDWATTYTRANLTEAASFVSGTCTNCFDPEFRLPGDTVTNVTYRGENDWVTEGSYGTKVRSPVVDDENVTVAVNRSYTADTGLPFALPIQFDFTGQYERTVFAPENGNRTNVTVAPGASGAARINVTGVAVPEISTPFCPSGYADFETYCKKESNIKSGTKYYYRQYLRPGTNEVKNVSVTHRVDSSRLLDWDNKANVKAYVNGTQANVSWTASNSGIDVTIEDDYGNSSVHKNTLYTTKVVYDNTGEDTGSNSGSGGGGGTTIIVDDGEKPAVTAGSPINVTVRGAIPTFSQVKLTNNRETAFTVDIKPVAQRPGCDLVSFGDTGSNTVSVQVNKPGSVTQQTGIGFQAAAPANATASCRFGLYRNSTETPVSMFTVNIENGPGLFAPVLAAVRFLGGLLDQFSSIVAPG